MTNCSSFCKTEGTSNAWCSVCQKSPLVLSKEGISLGAKYDSGKLRFSLLMRGLALPLKAVVAVLSYGAQKYEAESWKNVPDAKRRYEDAFDRHLNAWRSGEMHDDESGLHHLAHVACNCLFILWFEMQGTAYNWFKPNEITK